MKLAVFCFKDKQLNKYTVPSTTTIKDKEDLKEDVRTQIIKSDNRRVFMEKNLVYLGEFDNETGLLVTGDPEFLLNCDEVLSEVQDYERRKNNNSEVERS